MIGQPGKIGLHIEAGAMTRLTLVPIGKSAQIPANQTAGRLATLAAALLTEENLSHPDYIALDLRQGSHTGQRAISAFAQGLAMAWGVPIIPDADESIP